MTSGITSLASLGSSGSLDGRCASGSSPLDTVLGIHQTRCVARGARCLVTVHEATLKTWLRPEGPGQAGRAGQEDQSSVK